MTALAYHYTDTARLPWILLSGELRPGRNTFGGFPDPDFLWATTWPIIDRTAAPCSAAGLRALADGTTRSVRFSLSAADFEPWQEIVRRYPAWTPYEVVRLVRAAKGKSSPSSWLCRSTPLLRSSWLSVETRGAKDRNWVPLDLSIPVHVFDSSSAGVWINDRLFCSEQSEISPGVVSYAVAVMDREVAA